MNIKQWTSRAKQMSEQSYSDKVIEEVPSVIQNEIPTRKATDILSRYHVESAKN